MFRICRTELKEEQPLIVKLAENDPTLMFKNKIQNSSLRTEKKVYR